MKCACSILFKGLGIFVVLKTCISVLFLDRLQLNSLPRSVQQTNVDNSIILEIVVGHCHENLDYLDQFGSCQGIHIHIYSPCGDSIPEFSHVSACITVHTNISNCGRETYAYFEYIIERYDSLPPMVAFLQGSAITENPHIIYDIKHHIPGTTYSSLSRVALGAWHMGDDPIRKILQSELVPGLENETVWATGWRSQFLASRSALQSVSLLSYLGLNHAICSGKCEAVQCHLEVWLGPMLGCSSYLFKNSDCVMHTSDVALHHHMSDFEKDGLNGVNDTAITTDIYICQDNRSYLVSESSVNGIFTCLENVTDFETVENSLKAYSDGILHLDRIDWKKLIV